MYRVLEVNVDDTGYGGVFSLVKGVIAQDMRWVRRLFRGRYTV